MSTYSYAVKVCKTAPSVWRWDCPACGRWETSSSIRRARRRVYRWAVLHAATCSDLHWANWTACQPSSLTAQPSSEGMGFRVIF